MSFQVSGKATTCFKVQWKLHIYLKSKYGFKTLTPRCRQQHFTVLNVFFRDIKENISYKDLFMLYV